MNDEQADDSPGGEVDLSELDWNFFEHHTSSGITGTLGGVEVLGFDMHLPGRPGVWFELQDGMNVLYGKNGAGKSSILEAFRNFFDKDEADWTPRESHPQLDLYIKINPLVSLGAAALNLLIGDFDRWEWVWHWRFEVEMEAFAHSPLPNQGKPCGRQQDPSNFWEHVLKTSGAISLRAFVDAFEERVASLSEVQQRQLLEAVELLDLPTHSLAEKLAALAYYVFSSSSGPISDLHHFGWPDWYSKYLSHAAAVALFDAHEPRDEDEHQPHWKAKWDPKIRMEGNSGFQIVDELWDEATFQSLTSEPFKIVHRELFHYFAASKFRGYLSGEQAPWNEFVRVNLHNFDEFFDSHILRVTKSHGGAWEVHPAVEVNSMSSQLSSSIEIAESDKDRNFNRYGDGLEIHRSSNSKFVSLRLGENWNVRVLHLPFVLIDLDRASDPIEFFTSELALSADRNSTLVDLLPTWGTELDRKSSLVSMLFEDLDVGIMGVKASLASSPKKWLRGNAVEVSYLDANTRTWIEFEKASAAQKRWIGIATVLARAGQVSAPCLLLADEPDSGLHLAAGRGVSLALRGTGKTVLMSSHSPGVLRDGKAHLYHVQRGPMGETMIVADERREDPISHAAILGLDPVDLLPRIRTTVFVEGEHDRIALDAYLRFRTNQEMNATIRNRIQILANRGVGQMVNSVDTQILLDYTTSDVVIMADNIRARRFVEIVDILQRAQGAGQSEIELEKMLREWRRRVENSEPRKNFEPEERTMADVLSNAISRRSLHRIFIRGISAADITELLPPSTWGLAKPWETLHQEYNEAKKEIQAARRRGSSQKVPSFKKWLERTYSVEINNRTVSKKFFEACRSEGGPPEELSAIGDFILLSASRDSI